MNHTTANCVWGSVESLGLGRARMQCVDCGEWTPPITGDLLRVSKQCPAKNQLLPVRLNVGSQLRRIIDDLNVNKRAGCGCDQLEFDLNVAGPAVCRAQRAAIIVRLRKNASYYGVGDWTKAAVAAIKRGMTFIKLRDVVGSLLDEAIRRAETEEASRADDPLLERAL